MGGLGNQMFQYAIGKRLALLRNTELKVDVSFLNDKKLNHTMRKYELNIFSSNIQIANEAEVEKFYSVQKSKIMRGLKKLFPFLYTYHIVPEKQHEYSEDILNSPKNSLLIGYWQTEKYFKSIGNNIREDFKFKESLSGLNEELAKRIISSQSVSVHIRRGDYVLDKETREFHGLCTPEYYYSGIDFIKEKFPDINLFVFSDEMDWVKENMKFNVPVTYVENNSGNYSYIDMQLMSLCKHNIIANSSFSWWGAWLNNNPKKMVVAPAKWFLNSTVNTNDVIPETWHKL